MEKIILKYKGFIGSVNYDITDRLFYGKFEGIDDLVTYEGNNETELESAFRFMVNEHINDIKINKQCHIK